MNQPLDIWADDSNSSIAWAELAGVAVRRRWLIGIVFAIGTVLTAMIVLRPAPTYRAAAQLIVTSNRSRVAISPDASGSIIDMVTAQDLNAEVAMLSSTNAIREVLEHHRTGHELPPDQSWVRQIADVVTRPADWPVLLYSRFHAVTPATPFESWVRLSDAHTNVYVIKNTNLIEITHESENPVWAAQFVNDLVANHVDRHTRVFQQAQARDFIGTQRGLLSKTMRDAERALQDFSQREATNSVPDERAALRTQLVELQATMEGANRDLAEGQARAAFLRRAIQSQSKQLDADGPREQVRAKLLDLQLQRSQLLAQFAPTSIRVKDIDGQIAEAQRLLDSDKITNGGATNPTYQALTAELTQTEAQVAAVAARVEALKPQIASKTTRLEHLDEISPEYERLAQDVTSAHEALTIYRRKEEQARFSVALDESRIVNVEVVERAEVPATPLPSQATRRFILGALVSLVIGAALAYARDRLDPSVKTAAEAARLAKLPVLANIPS
jgi:uncharacterized protein involved in exopolysaccharide biosynthesis